MPGVGCSETEQALQRPGDRKVLSFPEVQLLPHEPTMTQDWLKVLQMPAPPIVIKTPHDDSGLHFLSVPQIQTLK